MTLYPSSNQYGIPDLLLDDLGVGLPSPVLPWGSTKRSALHSGTWHHYVDDYRFGGIWADPDAPIRTQCAAIVEPNYSVTPETPLAGPADVAAECVNLGVIHIPRGRR